MSVRLLVADDHRVVLEALTQLLESEPDFEVVKACDDSTGIVPAALELEPDLLVLDLKMPAMGGIDVVREMRRRKLEIPVVLLAATMADVEIVAAVQVGVRGIVLKDQSADELIDTIRGVARGEKRIAPELIQRALDAALFEDAVTGPLSERETEVMRFAVRGMKNQGIAEAVGIREGTVKFHLHNVFKKLGVKNRVELAVRARESDLL